MIRKYQFIISKYQGFWYDTRFLYHWCIMIYQISILSLCKKTVFILKLVNNSPSHARWIDNVCIVRQRNTKFKKITKKEKIDKSKSMFEKTLVLEESSEEEDRCSVVSSQSSEASHKSKYSNNSTSSKSRQTPVRSEAWKYFVKNSDDDAICNICKAKVRAHNTTHLFIYLERNHSSAYQTTEHHNSKFSGIFTFLNNSINLNHFEESASRV